MAPTTAFPDDPDARRALACLRAHTSGVLVIDGSPRPARVVYDGADGSVITTIDTRDTDAHEYQLCLPDDSFDTLVRSVLDMSVLGDDGPWADRHGAYHGPRGGADAGVWVRGVIEFVKLADGAVIDGDELAWANPLAPDQTRLCAAMNRGPDTLRRACLRGAGVEVERPVAVGIDPLGVDVRARFGVVRVVFDEPATEGAEALAMLNDLGRTDPA